MPELPEVETVRLQLLHKVAGRRIKSVEVFHDKTVGHDETIEAVLTGKVIAHIDRVGKLLIFSFEDTADVFLLAHLKMTGQFFFVDGDSVVTGGGHSMSEADIAQFPGKHTRVAFHFTDDATLYFNDMRLFGYTRLADAATVTEVRKGFGPEPIDLEFDSTWFSDTLRKKKTSVKAALLNQAFVAGLGNIYVDEALWRAQVLPTRRADSLSKEEALAIAHASGAVMREAIELGGTTFKDFADTGGKHGNFRDQLKVFARQGEGCERCGQEIVKIRCAGRGTHYCPGCQH